MNGSKSEKDSLEFENEINDDKIEAALEERGGALFSSGLMTYLVN